MRTVRSFPPLSLIIFGLSLSLPGLYGQTEKKLSAREIFYAAFEAPEAEKPTPPASKSVREPAKAKAPKETAKRETPPPSTRKEPELPTPAEAPTPPEAPPLAEPEAQLVLAAHATPPVTPLGLRYSILKRTEDARSAEVDPDSVFRAGDRIRLSIEVNGRGYLYIIHRGSSGIWKPLFPSPEIADGNNLVDRGHRYEIPAGYVFTFDEQAGVEKLFVVLSRQPEASLESLIYSLSSREAEAGKPAVPEEPEKPVAKTLLAQDLRPIEDTVVDRLRRAYARDLIIEKVDEATPGPKKEKAVYAVNPSRASDARVVADISLNHQ